jgi:hypothetical protein
LLRFDNGDFFEANNIKYILSNSPAKDTHFARAERFVIPLLENFDQVQENKELITLAYTTASTIKKGKKLVMKPEVLTNKGLELPSLNKLCVGKKYRYFYWKQKSFQCGKEVRIVMQENPFLFEILLVTKMMKITE